MAGKMPAGPTAETAVLLQTARELLRAHGATRIARELRVEWNSRFKTAAGRADYRQRLISLNPRLLDYSAEMDRTLRHELAHILAQFRAGRRRIVAHGNEPLGTLAGCANVNVRRLGAPKLDRIPDEVLQ